MARLLARFAAWRNERRQSAFYEALYKRTPDYCPHGRPIGLYCRECDYDAAMAVDADE